MIMGIKNNRKKRRFWVTGNLVTLILAVSIFELIKHKADFSTSFLWLFFGITLTGFIASFFLAFGKSGVWSLTHSRFNDLDERQIMVISNALRISYSIFTILVILIIYAYALFQRGPIDVILAAALLYLAHILPGSILAWHEKLL